MELEKKDWEALKTNAQSLIKNSKIGLFQGEALLTLSEQKLSELKTDDEKEEDSALKELVKEVVA